MPSPPADREADLPRCCSPKRCIEAPVSSSTTDASAYFCEIISDGKHILSACTTCGSVSKTHEASPTLQGVNKRRVTAFPCANDDPSPGAIQTDSVGQRWHRHRAIEMVSDAACVFGGGGGNGRVSRTGCLSVQCGWLSSDPMAVGVKGGTLRRSQRLLGRVPESRRAATKRALCPARPELGPGRTSLKRWRS